MGPERLTSTDQNDQAAHKSQGVLRGISLRAYVVVVLEASVPKVYPRRTLTSASTLPGSVVRTLRCEESPRKEDSVRSIANDRAVSLDC